MLAKQRYTKILELLDKDGIVHTAELVKLMGVSSETIRKDLEYLDSQRIFRGDTFPFRSATPRTWSKKLPSRQRQPAW